MTDFTFDPSGNVVESLVDNGDGTGTRTVYDEWGDVLTVETVTVDRPAPTVDPAAEAIAAARTALARLSPTGATRQAIEAVITAIDPTAQEAP